MASQLNPPLTARNGIMLMVLLICRVSDPREGKQDERSLGDQEALLRCWLADHTDLPFEVRVIAGDGSGERLDRPEVAQAEFEVQSAKYDLVLLEDLGRFLRRVQAPVLCELAEDAGTRLIALNDHLDTAREDWRMSAFFASFRHEQYNADTANRIRRTHRNRFTQGGSFQCTIFGYVKPPGAKSDADVHKDPAAEPIYDRWFTILEEGGTYADVADHLNQQGVAVGPYARNTKWDRRMVARITHNEILKGLRTRNKRIAKRVNSTGRRKCIVAPASELLVRECPHLAFIDPARFDRVIALLAERNRRFARGSENGVDSRKGVPRKRSHYPGQCIYCGVCGSLYAYGGHGQADHLMCTGAKNYTCWNGITVDGPLAAAKLTAAIGREVTSLPGFDDAFYREFAEQAEHVNGSVNDRLKAIADRLARCNAEATNLVRYLREGRASSTVEKELDRLEAEKAQLCQEQLRQEALLVKRPALPSLEELKSSFLTKLQELGTRDYELAAILRRFTPRIVVFPHQLVDGGKPVLRAKFRLQLAELIPDAAAKNVLRNSLEKIIEVDLFDPPQREEYRKRVVEGRQRGVTEAELADQLAITVTAAQRAMSLQRAMDERGLADPYLPMTGPPSTGKMRRHLHTRYAFAPKPDAGII